MNQMAMSNMGQFQNMMIPPNQFQYNGNPQGMLVDPMQMQMMFQNSNQNQDPSQAQQNLAMMAGFMPMQQPQFNNMAQPPIIVNIRSNQTGQDGST